ncbi:hypothetical protein O3M35_000081 [Rhynocoris fuscipes]|uniref:Flavin-containing monooxygenase n=1 Tax=Rhynocoris fuscipes TaxID=488301 RepID=A0AAW1DNX6_9HEMI
MLQFETCVTNVSRSDEEWIVTSCYLPTQEIHTEKYDAVFVCNGHYSIPEMPKFPGLEVFKKNKPDDVVIHTVKYRSPLHYKDKNVLIIGGGPSAQDISIDIASEAKLVYISHHVNVLLSVKFPDNIVHKPDIEYFTENGAVFTDGSSSHIDRVLLATGYRYNLDFLDDSCGVWVEDYGYVTPLYKQLINISQPTMAFIGLPFRTFIFPLFETQVKCMIKILSGKVSLPDRGEMYKDRRKEEENGKSKGIPKRKYHNLASRVRQYMNELYELGKLEPLEEVVFGIYEKTMALRKIDLVDYRNHKFRIKDSENFEVFHVGQSVGKTQC